MVIINGKRFCECCSKKMKDLYAYEKRHNKDPKKRYFCPPCYKIYESDREFAIGMDKHYKKDDDDDKCGKYYKEFFYKYKKLKEECIDKNTKK